MDARGLWPSGAVAPVNWWSWLAGKLLESVQPGPVLIGIRGVVPWAEETHETRSQAAYDDTFVLLAPGHDPKLFRGSSHAYQLFSKLSPDVNGDGVGDVATINPGRYVLHYRMLDGAGCPVFDLTLPDGSGNIPASRDLNHDGHVDGSIEAGPYVATAVLFHTGYDAPPGAEHRSSIACQTTSVQNLRDMAAAGHTIVYVLTTAERAIEIMGGYPTAADEPERLS